jgi:hypothetical protein
VISMLAILEIQGPDSEGRKMWLGSGETIRIGRTELADVALPSDRTLAPVHFSLTCTNDQCSAKSMDGSPIWLNGRNTDECVLRNGDVLQAGRTRFIVTIEGAADALSVVDDGVTPIARPDSQVETAESTYCEVQRTATGASMYRFPEDKASVGATLGRLREAAFLHVIADRESPWLATDRSRSPLFHWLPNRLISASPDVVLDLGSGEESMVEHAIADRECTFVLAPVTGDELLEHLRLAARGQVQRDERPDPARMLLSFDSERLDGVLAQPDADYVNFLFSKLTAVLYWSDATESWTFASGKQIDDAVQAAASVVIRPRPLNGHQPLAETMSEQPLSMDYAAC